MGSPGRPHSGDDAQFLVTSEARVKLLEALTESPKGATALCEDSGSPGRASAGT